MWTPKKKKITNKIGQVAVDVAKKTHNENSCVLDTHNFKSCLSMDWIELEKKWVAWFGACLWQIVSFRCRFGLVAVSTMIGWLSVDFNGEIQHKWHHVNSWRSKVEEAARPRRNTIQRKKDAKVQFSWFWAPRCSKWLRPHWTKYRAWGMVAFRHQHLRHQSCSNLKSLPKQIQSRQ